MTTKRYSMMHVPVLSFFSKDLYRDVGLNWKGVNFLYLLILLVVCHIPTAYMANVYFSNFVKNDAPAFVEQVPAIRIVDGELSIEEPQPYYITEPESGDVLAIIDTTGTIESLKDTEALVLVTETEIIWQKDQFQTQTFDLAPVEEFALDSDRIMGWLRVAGKYVGIVLYPLGLSSSYIYRIIQALIYAAIGLIFASSCKAVLSYATLIRLAVVAVTPCIITGTILDLASVSLPPLLYLAAAMVYLYIGVKSVSETTAEPEEIQFFENVDY